MGDKVDLIERRWQERTDPNDHRPIDALRVFVSRLERGEIDAKHVVIAYLSDEGNGFYVAGNLSLLESVGLLTSIQMLLIDR